MSTLSSNKSYGSVPDPAIIAKEHQVATSTPIKKKSCNDFLFALVFVAHIVYIVKAWLTSLSNNHEPGEEEEDETDAMDHGGVWKFVGVATGSALALSSVALVFMTTFSDELVEIALAVPVFGTIVVLVYGIVVGKVWMSVTGGVGLLLSVVAACLLYKKIDFAASNLQTALTVIRTNFGLIILAYMMELVAFGWTILWFDAFGARASSETSWGMLFLYLISFFWVHQTINNLQHTVAASVISTWFFNPEDANSCWDDGLNRAFCHSITYSFGSICLGSLLASFVQSLKWTYRLCKSHQYGSCIVRCMDCLLSCVQEMLETFNEWTFSYVGLFGESYIKSGAGVLKLFRDRNWHGIVEDILADVIMFVMKVAIALVTGLTGWWLVKYGDDDIFVGIGIDAEKDEILGFIAGCLIGYVVASIMMELVSSAVKSTIVCFAVAPAMFNKNHPLICKQMVAAWKKAYPNECTDEFETVTPLTEAVVL